MEEKLIDHNLPKVRVVILNYNQSKYTIDTVNYVIIQDYKNIEIVVVDNCSNEVEIKLLNNYLPESVFFIKNNENTGYAIGNNIGCKLLTKTTPKYYLILNNDVIIKDYSLISKLVLSINENSNVVAISPIINTISTRIPIEKQIQVRKILPAHKQFIVNSPFLNKIFYEIFDEYIYKKNMPFLQKSLIVDSINGAAFLIDGDFFRENNFFDEGTFLFLEEIILGKQIKDKGFTCLLNGYTIIDHLQGISTKSNPKSYNIKAEKYKLKSELFYFKKYFNINFIILKLIKIIRLLEIYTLKLIKG